MKNLLFPLFFLFSMPVFGQVVDSLAIDSLIKLNKQLVKEQKFEAATAAIEAAKSKAESVFGNTHYLYAKCLFNQGVTLNKNDRSQDALIFLHQSLEIQDSTWQNHVSFGDCLNTVAMIYSQRGQFDLAESFNLKSLSQREKLFGKAHPLFCASLNNLGNIYSKMGKFEKAEACFVEGMDIFENQLKKTEHPYYLNGLNQMAVFYMHIGDLDKAEQVFLRLKAIYEVKLNQRESATYSNCLNNLSLLYLETGRYEQAEALLFENQKITARLFGSETMEFSTNLENLGYLYFEMGNFSKFAECTFQSFAIREKILPETSTHFIESLNNVATAYEKIGNQEQAEICHLRAKGLFEKVLGKTHHRFGTSLLNLGNWYWETGKFEKSEPLLRESVKVFEQSLGQIHPKYVDAIRNLGEFYIEIGQLEKADSCFEVAQMKSQKVSRETYKIFLLNNLAEIRELQKRPAETDQFTREATQLNFQVLAKNVGFLSENELKENLKNFEHAAAQVASFAKERMKNGKKMGTLPELMFDNALFYKGFLLNAGGALNNLAASDPKIFEQSQNLKTLRRQLAGELTKTSAERDSTHVAQLEEKNGSAEKELARTAAGFGRIVQQVNWQEVQSALKPGEIAIEFVHFEVNFPKKTDGSGAKSNDGSRAKSNDSTMYAALILTADKNQKPQFVPLFEEKELLALLEKKASLRSDQLNDLYSFSKKGLAKLIFQPIEKHLNSLSFGEGRGEVTIYFSPTGLLHRLNFGAIPISPSGVGGETFSDRFHLVQLKSTRQLVLPDDLKTVGNGAVLFGGIRFDFDSVAMKMDETSMVARSRGISQNLSFSQTDSTLRGGSWSFLPGTEREINVLEKILNNAGITTTVKKGHGASEESFKNIGAAATSEGFKTLPTFSSGSPRILHLATHGYFFPDPVSASLNDRGGSVSPVVERSRNESVFKISTHPMLRSGLVLAGGNTAWQTGKPPKPGMEDGILTAFEISQMDLSNTELVVLSACETGLGDIAGNEGVYGLQRAFKIAGAKYVIMSLWKVSDEQTSELMRVFYEKWLTEKMTVPDAFRAAQSAMRERFDEPFLWAGFVLVE